MRFKIHTTDDQAIKFIADNNQEMSKESIKKHLRLGSERFRRLWKEADAQGLVKHLCKTKQKDTIKGIIKDLYGKVQRDEILARCGIGARRFYDLVDELVQTGEIEKKLGGIKPKATVSDSKLLRMYESNMPRKEIAEKTGLSESSIRRRVGNLRAKIEEKQEAEPWFMPRDSFGVMSKPWVSDKWINHNCKWLGE